MAGLSCYGLEEIRLPPLRTPCRRCDSPPDIDYLFAPLKHARLDYVVQKATELGARRLRPVITQRTIAERMNLERMRANAIEAAEQCNLVFVPEVLEPEKLDEDPCRLASRAVAGLLRRDRRRSPIRSRPCKACAAAAVLIGPEGGFTDDEKALLKSCPLSPPFRSAPASCAPIRRRLRP